MGSPTDSNHRPRQARAVVGSGYGDEGKGLMVDALANQSRAFTVVRYNGGAQAGHTVETPDGRRHVFHHIGSGSFAGAPTHLSRFFVCHPMMLAAELSELARLGVVPKVTVDPGSPVTTPYDVLINQAAEAARGSGRHGSCGMGFGETIERSERGYGLTAADLMDVPALRDHLDRLRRNYVPQRLVALGLSPEAVDAWRLNDRILERFVEDAQEFTGRIPLQITAEVSGDLLFEGAQGLRLDQIKGEFPYVTRSYTGLRNVCILAKELGIPNVDAVYVTRCYRTRHGAGPLAHEQPEPPCRGFTDPTNRPNPHQGVLRFAPLDVDTLAGDVHTDAREAEESGTNVRVFVAVTCLDQIQQKVAVRKNGQQHRWDAREVTAAIAEGVRPAGVFESHGPTWQTIKTPASFGAFLPNPSNSPSPNPSRKPG